MAVKMLGRSDANNAAASDLDALLVLATNAAADASAAANAFPSNENRTVATLAAYLADNALYNIMDYGALADAGTTNTDNTAALTAALTAAAATDGVVYVPARALPFGVLSSFTVPANVTLTGPGIIKALAAFTDPYMALMAENSELSVRVLDGTGMANPSGAWTGAGVGLARAPQGCAIFINGSSGSEITDIRIGVDTFQNFPSGPICAFYADDIVVTSRRYNTVQTYTANETNAVLQMQNVVRPRIYGGLISGYSWKGYAFASCTDGLGVACKAENGVTGHAAHYDTTSTRCGFIGCGHDGTSGGDGYKGFQSAGPYVRAYTSVSSTGSAVNFDGCTDYELDGLHAIDPANTGVYLAAETADLLRGNISHWFVNRTSQGTTDNHVAVKIVSNASFDIDGLVLGPGVARNGFYGIYGLPVSGAVVSNLVFSAGIRYELNAQYDVIVYCESVDMQGGRVIRAASSGSGTDVFFSSQATVQGEVCRIGPVHIDGFGTTDAMVEVSGNWDSVIVDGLSTRLGGEAFKTTAGNQIKNLSIPCLYAYDPGQTTACELIFNQALTTRLSIGDIQLPTAAGGVKFLGVAVSGSAVVEGWGVITLTDASTISLDPHNGQDFVVTLTDNRTMGAPSNPIKGMQINITVIQDGTGGRTLAWNAVFKQSWSNTGNTLGLRSSISFVYDGTNWNQISAQTPYV